MSILTYADRESLLSTLGALKDSPIENNSLLAAATSWAKELTPEFGFEHSLIRDITVLCRYLTHDNRDASELARGALQYVLRSRKVAPPLAQTKLGFHGDAFIANYSVYEIRTKLGEKAVYNPPKLLDSEKTLAETLFLDFIDNPLSNDKELANKALSISKELGYLANSGFLKRLQKNTEFLCELLLNSNSNPEQCSYARAALSYLICEDDAIKDSSGLIGYLDDNFIVQLAVDFIISEREPWLDLLDATAACWPFINWLIIDDGSGDNRPISEYMIINSALSCEYLRDSKANQSTVLIAPTTGPTPLMVGFISALGLTEELRRSNAAQFAFKEGQKVLVDGSSIAEFTGIEKISNEEMFGLRQSHMREGQSAPVVTHWPLSELYRLLPADDERVPRGKLTRDLDKSSVPLPALEFLLSSMTRGILASLTKRIIIVTKTGAAHEIAKTLKVFGQELRHVIPMGHLTVDNSITSWSEEFGTIAPVLIFVSDLDSACIFAEENLETIDSMIIDVSDHNGNKTASLNRIIAMDIRVLVIVPERLAYETPITADEYADIWEWTNDDLSSLLWPSQSRKNSDGILSRYEHNIRIQATAKPTIHTISLESGKEAYDSIRNIKLVMNDRGDDQITEMEQCLDLAYNTMSHLLRSGFTLTQSTESHKVIDAGLRQLANIRETSKYITDAECSVITQAESTLQQLFSEIQNYNSKSELISDILSDQPDLMLVCPDVRLLDDLRKFWPANEVVRQHPIENKSSGVVIPGWFRKEHMSKLLVPPKSTHTHLILYDIEHQWYSAFENQRQNSHRHRSARSNRSKIFPRVEGWKNRKYRIAEPATSQYSPGAQDIAEIQRHIDLNYKKNLYMSARSTGSGEETEAQLVIFGNGCYAFLTKSYEASTITHLLDGTVDYEKEEAKIIQKTIEEITPGDALLFKRGSSHDIIRLFADQLLTPGIRETALLWKTSLIDYASRESLSGEQIHQKLRTHGCPLHFQTIRNWLGNDQIISPQSYQRDVAIIAEVTKEPQLNGKLGEVFAAIHEVRGAHIRASHLLAKQVINNALAVIEQEGEKTSAFELESDVFIVRVVEIDDIPTLVRTSLINQILEDKQWQG